MMKINNLKYTRNTRFKMHTWNQNRTNVGLLCVHIWMQFWKCTKLEPDSRHSHQSYIDHKYVSTRLQQKYTGAPSQYKDGLYRYGISMLKIRRSRDRLIFNTGTPTLVRLHLYIATPPRAQFSNRLQRLDCRQGAGIVTPALPPDVMCHCLHSESSMCVIGEGFPWGGNSVFF